LPPRVTAFRDRGLAAVALQNYEVEEVFMSTIARSLLGLAIAASLLWPIPAAAQKSYDYRQSRDLTQPRSFAFKNDGPVVDESTNMAIAAELERRGWTRSDDSPEVYVVTRRTFRKQYVAYGPFWGPYYQSAGWYGPYPYAYYSRPGEGWATSDPNGPVNWDETVRGTLTIDLQNAATGTLLWRGIGTRDAHDHSTASRQTTHVNHEVEHIFEHFPAAR